MASTRPSTMIVALALLAACSQGTQPGASSGDSGAGELTVESMEQSLGLRVGWIPQDCLPVTFEGPGAAPSLGAVNFSCGGASTSFTIARLPASGASSELPDTPFQAVGGRITWFERDAGAVIEVTGSGVAKTDLLRIAVSIEVVGN